MPAADELLNQSKNVSRDEWGPRVARGTDALRAPQILPAPSRSMTTCRDKAENPYRSPGTGQFAVTTDAPEDAHAAELKAFVGSNAEYYLRRWAPVLESHMPTAGRNWVALFVPGLWLAYRRMYRTWLIFMVSTWLAGAALGLVLGIFNRPELLLPAAFVATIVVNAICCENGNRWYLSHAERKIEQARAQGFKDKHLLYVLSERGGTGLSAAIGLNILFGIATNAVVQFAVAAIKDAM